MVEPIESSERLTRLAHVLASQVIEQGDTVVDATAGNGYDTVFLRKCVGSAGRVYAFDIQDVALQETKARLAHEFGSADSNVELLEGCHSTLDTRLPSDIRRRAGCIVFNLGYLPGADHAVTTQGLTTRKALMASVGLLRPGGIVTVLVYTGHPTGAEELQVVSALASSNLIEGVTWRQYVSDQSSETAPQLFVARKNM